LHDVILRRYRALLADRQTRRLMIGLGVSSVGDGMSIVTIAWLAVQIAPHGALGVFVGATVAAYTLPGAIGALAFARLLRRRPPRVLVLANCALRASLLGAVAVLSLTGDLSPYSCLLLLAGSSILSAWGTAGEYTMLSALGGPAGRLAANSLATAQASAAVILGPAIAGVLLARTSPAWLIAMDAASFAYLGVQASRVTMATSATAESLEAPAAPSGLQLLRAKRLLSLIVVTWFFFFLYGPVEDALPVYVARDLHSHGSLLGVYWAAFGAGALIASLITGALHSRENRRVTVLIMAGWGACLIPFAFAPTGVTIGCFALGGLIYGPFIPLTYSIFQSAAPTASLPSVLAARSAFTVIATPLGTALGGPLVAAVGAAATLTASGGATILLAGATALGWQIHLRPHDVAPAIDRS
jgi:predicted MFS family arabinose efflux permease